MPKQDSPRKKNPSRDSPAEIGASAEAERPMAARRDKPVTLKAVAEHLGLSPATVSLVLNRSPNADSIPQETQERVFAAARELAYRPNYLARSLRNQRSHTVGVVVPEISAGYASGVMSGIEDHLLSEGFFYLVASHRGLAERLDENIRVLEDRLVEGLLLLASPLHSVPHLPTVAIAGHRELDGVTNVILDHDYGIRHALGHLVELGHQRIAFFKGPPNSADTDDRWRSIHKVTADFGLSMHPELTLQLAGDPRASSTPEVSYREGYAFGLKMLERGQPFTTLFAFNDVSAIGAMRAFLDAGLRVPEDVSVMGFDDIQNAAFHNPSLTTVRQPLHEMGVIAGRILLQRLGGL
jgi:LacI family transcriptional regulator, galactose operon repressor